MSRALRLTVALLFALALSGCEDDPYCFGPDCVASQGGGQGSTATGVGGSLFQTSSSGVGGNVPCELTNGGTEICDSLDNDCDGETDEDIDYNSIHYCGTCDNNCYAQLLNVDPTTITCDWGGTIGVPGECNFTACAPNYFDDDPNIPGCEYYCVQIANDDATCNNKDDDCDFLKDEDVDKCTDVDNCGECGIKCIVPHGTGQCVNLTVPPCTQANTECQILSCDTGWWDVNPNIPGCEYNCTQTNNGTEICGDGLDNDCDGDIDGADSDLTGDPQIGLVCYGDPDGLCADPSHAGTTQCVGQQVLCQGMAVITENLFPEICNGVDDDCDGTVDDGPTDAGGSCGVSNVFPCSLGTLLCQNGALNCVGDNNPTPELCNGVDDDCDTVIDDNPTNAGGACNVPPPPPPNSTSPCTAGTLTCQAGALICSGWTGPTSSTDSCGVDANCDGQLTNQPNLTNNVNNCGSCGNNCYAGAVHSLWACVNSACVFQGCEPGWYDISPVDQKCEYPCVFSGSEICDNLDNNCNGLVDDGLTPPSPKQVCGVAQAANRPECTTQVGVACSGGTWQCTFPAGVCSPTCQAAVEVCDLLDNDCDGLFNENTPNYGQPCASDDGLPPPGHGACKTFGTFICNGPSATQCSAQAASCTTVPGGCTEKCDNVDNDCDGSVDEDYLAKGSNPTYFVKPAVTQVASSLFVMSYEASRPNATATSAGTGNGYHCASCPPGIPPAPSGEPLDETLACSVPNVLPWFNVDAIEAEQTCDEIGGFLCGLAEWQTACKTTTAIDCDWGYNPRGTACNTPATSTKYCNLEPFDFNLSVAGNQNGLLPTGSSLLANCWSDWLGLFNNTQPSVFDITGNLRELAHSGGTVYTLMGGAFNSAEIGSACQFDFYSVNQDFKLLDTGFRCCFASDPRL